MLVKAVEAEVTAYIEGHQHEVDEDGRRLVVRDVPVETMWDQLGMQVQCSLLMSTAMPEMTRKVPLKQSTITFNPVQEPVKNGTPWRFR